MCRFNSLKSCKETFSVPSLNRFILSVKQWVEKTNSKGIIAKAGRYGGTYAHKDIAFEFATWVSPQFKLYLLKEFQRLKEEEQAQALSRAISVAIKSLSKDALDYIKEISGGDTVGYLTTRIQAQISRNKGVSK